MVGEADRLLTAEDVGGILSVKPTTVMQWARAGVLPHVRIGRVIRFRQKSVLRWIEEREKESGRLGKLG